MIDCIFANAFVSTRRAADRFLGRDDRCADPTRELMVRKRVHAITGAFCGMIADEHDRRCLRNHAAFCDFSGIADDMAVSF